MRIRHGNLPKGRWWNFWETLLVFVRDDIARPNLGGHHHPEEGDKFLPFLWTLFMFILFCNLLGMIPTLGSPTASIWTTFGLALCSLVMLHGAAIAKGRITSIDLKAANVAPGVLAIVTAKNAGKLGNGSWATSLIWGRVHKVADEHNLNGYVLESTLNFLSKNYAFTRLELVDKDELFPGNPLSPSDRIGAYTFGGARDLVQSRLWQLALGADLTLYSKPDSLNAVYGTEPVSFQIFLRVRPSLSEHHAH